MAAFGFSGLEGAGISRKDPLREDSGSAWVMPSNRERSEGKAALLGLLVHVAGGGGGAGEYQKEV